MKTEFEGLSSSFVWFETDFWGFWDGPKNVEARFIISEKPS